MDPQLKPAKRLNYRERARLGLVKAKPRSRIKSVADKKKTNLSLYSKWSKLITSSCSQCQKCGKVNGVEPHHPSGRSRHHLFEIMLLCHDCHAWVHANPNTAFKDGWLTPEYRGYQPDPDHKLASHVFTFFKHRYTARIGGTISKEFDDLTEAKRYVLDHIEKSCIDGIEVWFITDNAIMGRVLNQSGDLK